MKPAPSVFLLIIAYGPSLLHDTSHITRVSGPESLSFVRYIAQYRRDCLKCVLEDVNRIGSNILPLSAPPRPSSLHDYSFFSFSISANLKNRLSSIATMVASAIPFSEKLPAVNVAPLIPMMRTTAVKIKFEALE